MPTWAYSTAIPFNLVLPAHKASWIIESMYGLLLLISWCSWNSIQQSSQVAAASVFLRFCVENIGAADDCYCATHLNCGFLMALKGFFPSASSVHIQLDLFAYSIIRSRKSYLCIFFLLARHVDAYVHACMQARFCVWIWCHHVTYWGVSRLT